MSSLLFHDVRIFTGETTIPTGSVLILDGKIHRVSSSRLEAPNACTEIISKPGHTLLPGLIDAHIHASGGTVIALPQSLRFGVTTVCDMQNEVEHVVSLRKQSKGTDAADYKTCSLAATVKGGWPEAVVTLHDKSPETAAGIATWPDLETEQDAETYVATRVSQDHVDYIKLMHESGSCLKVKPRLPTIQLQKAVIDAAHARGLVVVAHALAHDDAVAILNAGTDGTTHTFMDKPPTKELIAAYERNNAHCNPTLAAIGSLTEEGLSMQEAYAHDARVQFVLGAEEKHRMCLCMSMATGDCRVEYAYESVRQLKAAGVDIVCGSDAAGPAIGTAWGLSLHQELALFVQKCGFTPEEALRAATSVTSRRFNFHDRGRISEGLKADLVLVEGNPLENIDHTLDIRGVWKNGVLCSAYGSAYGSSSDIGKGWPADLVQPTFQANVKPDGGLEFPHQHPSW